MQIFRYWFWKMFSDATSVPCLPCLLIIETDTNHFKMSFSSCLNPQKHWNVSLQKSWLQTSQRKSLMNWKKAIDALLFRQQLRQIKCTQQQPPCLLQHSGGQNSAWAVGISPVLRAAPKTATSGLRAGLSWGIVLYSGTPSARHRSGPVFLNQGGTIPISLRKPLGWYKHQQQTPGVRP